MSELPNHPMFGARERRLLAGIKTIQAAKAIGVDPNTYGRYERGERRIYLDRARTLARLFNCTIDQLAQPLSIDEQLAIREAERQERAAEGAQLEPSNSPTAKRGRPVVWTEKKAIETALAEGRAARGLGPVVIPVTPAEDMDEVRKLIAEWDDLPDPSS